MLIEVMRRVMWRRRVRAVHTWRDEQRVEYAQAVERITAAPPYGMGTLRRPRS
ncbi:hypothetical protein [Actinoplanes xinjiangensis]|jgi:hypothetical protein|uniref:Uncharacterized protein n=1 Tax=Actinoplanes xinjiangensis TaxID=512350 RepID=A0A316EJS6_9ACTN|nr:hypothetical protein [Actinoplanes xinjiangensis]PWK29099.1 hypothetical protein BC793_14713 [Actinoplanes xinjiangensis]GIF45042.1 hypothetical protein Axi01nite_93530 [Actinoplanes xinjiangensis]